MSAPLIIFLVTILAFIPLSGALLYVWWKYGKQERWVAVARVIFLTGALLLLGSMLII